MLQKKYSIEKEYAHLIKNKPEKITGIELQTIPVFKDKNEWISASRIGDFMGFPFIQKKSIIPLDCSFGIVGYYNTQNGYIPLFKPKCEVTFLSNYSELTALYKEGGHDIFLLPVERAELIPNIQVIPDLEIKRYITTFLNSFDVHIMLTKKQIDKIFGKNLFSSNKYFITSGNNIQNQDYYSIFEFELFEDIKLNLEQISSKIAVNYKNFERKYYRIDIEKANTILKKKITNKSDRKKFYFIPEKEFFGILKNKYHKKTEFEKYLENNEISIVELMKKSDLISIKRDNKGFLFDKNTFKKLTNLEVINTKKIRKDLIEVNVIEKLNFHPLLTKTVKNYYHVYNISLNKMYCDYSKFKKEFSYIYPLENNDKTSILIPREFIKKFVVKYYRLFDNVIFLGIVDDNFCFSLEGDSLKYELEILLEFN